MDADIDLVDWRVRFLDRSGPIARRRPQPNPRRGVLRAAVTVVVLTALLVIAILVVSSLTAPSAKAPTTPPTPGPITPITTGTPGKTGTATPAPTPSATAPKKVLGVRVGGPPSITSMERSVPVEPAASAAVRPVPGIAVRAGNLIASFGPAGARPASAPLYVQTVGSGSRVYVGTGDPFVRPIWSRDGRHLLYVTVTPVQSQPGATWTLRRYDVWSRLSEPLAHATAMALFPLGWWNSRVLYAVANSTDTSLYTADAGGTHSVSILLSQIITSAVLSPSGRYVALAAPTNCSTCTLDIFDLADFSVWIGPTGMTDESQMAWSRAPESLVTRLGSNLAAVNPASHDIQRFAPAGVLPTVWRHSLLATASRDGVQVRDTVTGSVVSGRGPVSGS